MFEGLLSVGPTPSIFLPLKSNEYNCTHTRPLGFSVHQVLFQHHKCSTFSSSYFSPFSYFSYFFYFSYFSFISYLPKLSNFLTFPTFSDFPFFHHFHHFHKFHQFLLNYKMPYKVLAQMMEVMESMEVIGM